MNRSWELDCSTLAGVGLGRRVYLYLAQFGKLQKAQNRGEDEAPKRPISDLGAEQESDREICPLRSAKRGTGLEHPGTSLHAS